jgi:UPF0042 nucleotide-binding protein
LPIPLFGEFVSSLEGGETVNVAISVDGRQIRFMAEYDRQIESLKAAGHQVEVLFLEAADAVLCRRYSETRRLHPLSGEDIIEGIRQDRAALSELRKQGAVINTGGLNVHEIKEIITARYGSNTRKMTIKVMSFGFKNGLPIDANNVFDVRFLPNPHFDPILRPMDGRDRDVSEYVFSGPTATPTVDKIEDFVNFALPQYEAEGKLYLTVAIGCTGGRHRSVALTEELARRLGDKWRVLVRHRDLEMQANGGGVA